MIIRIEPLSAETEADFFEFFDNRAFTNNPNWDGCYCEFYHFAGAMDKWMQRSKTENRISAQNRIQASTKPGFLIYANTTPVGWMNAGPKTSYPGLFRDSRLKSAEDNKIISIMCFIIDPNHRRKGLANHLLEYASRYFADKILEAYPFTNPKDDAGHYHGPISMYKKAGFEVTHQYAEFWVMRKSPQLLGIDDKS